MSRGGLSVSIDSTYIDSGTDPTVQYHQADHDKVHTVVNLLDNVTGQPLAVTNTRTSSYTAVLTDEGKVIEMNVSSANNLTIPPNSSVAFPIGTVIWGRQYGTGLTTVAYTSPVVVHSRGNVFNSAGQYAEWQLTKRATDEWILTGDIA